MTELKECPFCKSRAIVICRVDAEGGWATGFKLLNDRSNYDTETQAQFDDYDPDFYGDSWDIDIFRCRTCGAEWTKNTYAHIAGLKANAEKAEAENKKMREYYRQPNHGPCCTCQRCGHSYDECRCDFDKAFDELDKAKSERDEARVMVERLIEAIESGCYIQLSPELEVEKIQEWYAKMEALAAEWKEMQK